MGERSVIKIGLVYYCVTAFLLIIVFFTVPFSNAENSERVFVNHELGLVKKTRSAQTLDPKDPEVVQVLTAGKNLFELELSKNLLLLSFVLSPVIFLICALDRFSSYFKSTVLLFAYILIAVFGVTSIGFIALGVVGAYGWPTILCINKR
jgi:hypothetical protein